LSYFNVCNGPSLSSVTDCSAFEGVVAAPPRIDRWERTDVEDLGVFGGALVFCFTGVLVLGGIALPAGAFSNMPISSVVEGIEEVSRVSAGTVPLRWTALLNEDLLAELAFLCRLGRLARGGPVWLGDTETDLEAARLAATYEGDNDCCGCTCCTCIRAALL
jgi:hypothetical protein